jgi:geranylgeranyl pyrophosphate synthase
LPLIYLLEKDPGAATMVRDVLVQGTYDSVSQHDLLAAINRVGALDLAREKAHDYAGKALAALDNLRESEYCDALRAIPAYVIERDR